VHGCDQRGLDIPSHVFSGSAESRLVRVLVLGMEYRVHREWNGADPEWSCVNRGSGDKRTGDTGTRGQGDEETRSLRARRALLHTARPSNVSVVSSTEYGVYYL
jgi:hypothetical protein